MENNHAIDLPSLSTSLDRYFGIKAAGSSVKVEIIAGITTFLTAMYIIVVNPSILSAAGMPFSAALTATVIVSFIGSCAMGLYARNPILVGPGMGMNALFAFVMVRGGGIPWQTALGCVFWAGVIFTLLASFNARKYVVDAIPSNLRHAMSCGIGLFICLVGLVNAKFIATDPVTIVHGAPLNPIIITFLIGLAISIGLVARRITGALTIGIIITTVIAIPIGRWWGDGTAYWPAAIATKTLVNWQGFIAAPDFSGIGQLDLLGALKFVYWPFIFVMLFTSFFDALSTLMAVSDAGNLLDENGNPRNLRKSMVADSLSALISAPLGTSPANAYIESAAGISAGGRTGLVAFVAGLCFLPFLFISPLLSLVPSIATAPALIIVGIFMMDAITKIDWHRFDEATPAFMTMILIPLTYSITDGVTWGFLSFVLIKLFTGRVQEVKPAMWVVTALSVLLLTQM